MPPANDSKTWLKFCSLCRKAGRSSLSRKLLSQLLPDDDKGALARVASSTNTFEDALSAAGPAVAFAHLKQLWADRTGHDGRYEVLERLRAFARDAVSPTAVVDHRLAAKSWLKLGEWQRALLEANSLGDARKMQVVVQSLQRATELNPESYKAW